MYFPMGQMGMFLIAMFVEEFQVSHRRTPHASVRDPRAVFEPKWSLLKPKNKWG